jgi:hypothetical protein
MNVIDSFKRSRHKYCHHLNYTLFVLLLIIYYIIMILVKLLTYNDINLSIKIKLQTHNVKKRKEKAASLAWKMIPSS